LRLPSDLTDEEGLIFEPFTGRWRKWTWRKIAEAMPFLWRAGLPPPSPGQAMADAFTWSVSADIVRTALILRLAR